MWTKPRDFETLTKSKPKRTTWCAVKFRFQRHIFRASCKEAMRPLSTLAASAVAGIATAAAISSSWHADLDSQKTDRLSVSDSSPVVNGTTAFVDVSMQEDVHVRYSLAILSKILLSKRTGRPEEPACLNMKYMKMKVHSTNITAFWWSPTWECWEFKHLNI